MALWQQAFDILQHAYQLHSVESNQWRESMDALRQENTGLTQKNTSLSEEVAALKEQLRLLQAEHFGQRSEKSATTLDHAATSDNNSGKVAGNPESSEQHRETSTVRRHTRKKPKRGRRHVNDADLPRYTVIHDLPEGEQCCETCQGKRHRVGEDVSEQVEVIPKQYCVIEHVRLKYGCRACDTLRMAPKPPPPLPKTIAGASLLTDVAVNKYQHHLPLYRQSKMMKQVGLPITDNTLANWMVAAGKALLPVYDAMWTILSSRYLQVDETPVKLLEGNKKGYVWVYFAPNFNKDLVVFEFSQTRSGSVASERLACFNGLLQTDGYAGYQALRQREGIIGFGCLSHARRKFSEVVKITDNKQGVAAEMMIRLKPLYALEARLRKANATHRTRKRLRQKIARPRLKDIHRWLKRIQPTVPPTSKLGKAIAYTLNQWPYLVAYLKHGMAEIDTNNVENTIRGIALGRKNWLFIGNEHTGKMHALWYSLITSAICNNLNPRLGGFK